MAEHQVMHNGRPIRVASPRAKAQLEARIIKLADKDRQTVKDVRNNKLGPRSVAGNNLNGWVSKSYHRKHETDKVLVYTTEK